MQKLRANGETPASSTLTAREKYKLNTALETVTFTLSSALNHYSGSRIVIALSASATQGDSVKIFEKNRKKMLFSNP
jgi:hypothetical protein